MSDLVGNPEDRFSRVAPHLVCTQHLKFICLNLQNRCQIRQVFVLVLPCRYSHIMKLKILWSPYMAYRTHAGWNLKICIIKIEDDKCYTSYSNHHQSKWKFNNLDVSHRIRKPTICIGENKGAVTAQLISTFVFATQIVQSLFFLIPNFKILAIFCDCTACLCCTWSETQIVGFLTHRLICFVHKK